MEKKENKRTKQAGAELCQAQSSDKPGNLLPCPLFLRTHCPNIRRGCTYHHSTKTCSQGDACAQKSCELRHPPKCELYLQGWCGWVTKEGIPKRYKYCSYFHSPEVNQVPPSTSSVMLTTTAPNTITAPATGQNTPPENITEDTQMIPKQNNMLGLSWWPSLPQNKNQVSNAKSEIEVNSGISPANQVIKELSDLNSKIVKIEQNLSLLADKMANMDTKIKFIEESTKKIDNMDTKINQVDEAIKQFDSMDTRTKLIEEVTKKIANMETRVTMLEGRVENNTFSTDSNDIRIGKLWESLGKEEHSASQFKDKTNKKLMELENKLTSAAPRQRDSNPLT